MTSSEVVGRSQIPQVMLRYAALLDDNDVSGILSCFSDEAHVEFLGGAIVLDGQAQLRAHYERMVANRRSQAPESKSMHSVANTLLVREDGHRVLTRTVGTVHSYTSSAEPVTVRGLKYSCVFEGIRGDWRITSMSQETLWEGRMGA